MEPSTVRIKKAKCMPEASGHGVQHVQSTEEKLIFRFIDLCPN